MACQLDSEKGLDMSDAWEGMVFTERGKRHLSALTDTYCAAIVCAATSGNRDNVLDAMASGDACNFILKCMEDVHNAKGVK